MEGSMLVDLILGLGGGMVVMMVANWREHKELHKKIDVVHHSMRDRLDKIWVHMKTPGS